MAITNQSGENPCQAWARAFGGKQGCGSSKQGWKGANRGYGGRCGGYSNAFQGIFGMIQELDKMYNQDTRVQTVEDEATYSVYVEVPGFSKSDVTIEVEGNILKIKGERKESFKEAKTDSKGDSVVGDQPEETQKQPSDEEKQQEVREPAQNEQETTKAQQEAEVPLEGTSAQPQAPQRQDIVHHQVQLGEDIDAEKITAKLEDGLLSVTIPKIPKKRYGISIE